MTDKEFEKSTKLLKNFIFKQHKKEFKRCLWYEKKCKNKIIHAHSIQNKKILSKLSKNSEVIILHYELNLDEGPKAYFKPLGINKATTFTGFCSYHDNQVFAPIEKNNIDCKNDEHLFLLAYKALCREFHSKLRAANNIGSFIEESDKLGLQDEWKKDILGKMSIPFIAESYSTYRYKFIMDKVYREKCYNNYFENIVISVPIERLSLAVNSCFSPIDNMINYKDRIDPKMIMLNIFSQDSENKIIFSFRKGHSEIIKEFLNPILSSTGIYQKYLISKLVLQNCENFVLSPDYFSTISLQKQQDIIEYFSINLYAKKTDYENENLYLF